MGSQAGLCIAVDGADGVGKTTQIQLLAEWFQAQGRNVFLTRTSGGSEIGDLLRKVSLSDTLRPPETDFHISLAMAEAALHDILEALEAGSVVIIDRSPLSWLAYNAYGANMVDKGPVISALPLYLQKMKLDVLFFLSADETILAKRLKSRVDKPSDFFEKQPPEFRERVLEGFKHGIELAKQIMPVLEIDASPPIEEVQQSMRSALNSYLQ